MTPLKFHKFPTHTDVWGDVDGEEFRQIGTIRNGSYEPLIEVSPGHVDTFDLTLEELRQVVAYMERNQ